MQTNQYDAIVIGAGQGGGPLAGKLAESGGRVAIIERKHVGGSCINEGCTRTKTMVASARVAYLARRGADYGVRINDVTVDQTVVRQRKRDIVESFRSGSQKGLERWAELDLIMGEARFTGPREVTVALNGGGAQVLAADTIVINTGARPRIPDLTGLSDVPYLDSTSIMELDAVPSHLIVLGGGFVGLEFGQMFRRFGSAVTVVERGSRLAPREDEDVCQALGEILRGDGIEVKTGVAVNRVAADDGEVALTLETDDGGAGVPSDKVRNPYGAMMPPRGERQLSDEQLRAVPPMYGVCAGWPSTQFRRHEAGCIPTRQPCDCRDVAAAWLARRLDHMGIPAVVG